MQVVPDGFEFFADKKLVTVYSAPDYDGGNNLAATMSIARNMTCTFQVSKHYTLIRSFKWTFF